MRMQSGPDGRKERTSYLPTLDGWRAIAILAVMFTHDDLHTLGPFSTRWLYEFGAKGVDVFFAISGILICTRLLEEEDLLGRISLRNFYIRRAFRILPAAVAYLVVVGILGAFGLIFVYNREWLAALLFCRNYTLLLGHVDPNRAYFTGHYWSLSVEEHFYFMLPALLILTPKRWRVTVLLSLALMVIINCAIQLHARPWDLVSHHTDTRLACLLAPAALAVIARTTSGRRHLVRLLRYPGLLVLLTLAVIPTIAETGPGSFWQITSLVFLMPLMIMGTMLHPQTLLGKVLEWAPVRYIGRISYSLYLWQTLFFTGHYYALRPLGKLEMWPLNIVAAFACAIASYYLLERPMLRVGHRLAPPASRGRPVPEPLFNSRSLATRGNPACEGQSNRA